MAKVKTKEVKIYLDPVANTFNIWWDDPKKASFSEEVDSPYRNDVIIKDKQGRPISLEVIGIFPSELNITEKLKKTIGEKEEPLLLQTI
jgi:hypothetical protein